jgi:hypothetical protein
VWSFPRYHPRQAGVGYPEIHEDWNPTLRASDTQLCGEFAVSKYDGTPKRRRSAMQQATPD